MGALDDLRQLSENVDGLRRTGMNRFHGLVTSNALLAACVLALAVVSRTRSEVPPSEPPIVRASGFELLDAEGTPRATLTMNREGQPELAMVGTERMTVTLGFSRVPGHFPLLSFGDDKKDSFLVVNTPTGPELHLYKPGSDADPAAHTILRGGALYLQSDPNGAFFQCGVFGKDRFKTSSCYLDLHDGDGNEQFCATPKMHGSP